MLEQSFSHVLILDFEATCLKDRQISPQEIIEFPCILIDLKTFETVREFHKYVKPVKRPRLSPFCFELTGISQKTVDLSSTFPDVYAQFLSWLRELRENVDVVSLVTMTCGDWDLNEMLINQLNVSGISYDDVPHCLKHWINVKKLFEKEVGIKIEKQKNDLQQMLEAFGMQLEGKLHSGIQDVKNIAKVVKALAHFTVFCPCLTSEKGKRKDSPDLTCSNTTLCPKHRLGLQGICAQSQNKSDEA